MLDAIENTPGSGRWPEMQLRRREMGDFVHKPAFRHFEMRNETLAIQIGWLRGQRGKCECQEYSQTADRHTANIPGTRLSPPFCISRHGLHNRRLLDTYDRRLQRHRLQVHQIMVRLGLRVNRERVLAGLVDVYVAQLESLIHKPFSSRRHFSLEALIANAHAEARALP